MLIRPSRYAPVALLLGLGLSACGGEQQGAGQAPPPPEVGVVTLAPRPLQLTRDLPGRTNAYRISEVRPQVNGIILRRAFEEGAEVKGGELLYQIDPAPYQAAYDSARAALARANAAVETARQRADRYRGLVAAQAVSRQDYDDAVATFDQARADVASAQASVESARINLAYTRLSSPIAGRTSTSTVTEGALVTANQADALTTVQQLDPIYVDVNQSSAELLRLRRDLVEGRLQKAGEDQARVRLLLEDGSEYAHEGVLKFAGVTVDPGTGTVTLRAIFPNPDRQLLPGMFVRAELAEGLMPDAILAPQLGVTRDPKGQATALVVNGENKVEPRVLKTDRPIGDQWLVLEGLAAGDKLIVSGLQKVRPGMAVRPVEAAPQPQQPAPPGGAAPAAAGQAS
jgi:membrane fusion protein (multidrug efflux system)